MRWLEQNAGRWERRSKDSRFLKKKNGSVCTRRRLLFVESAKRWDGVVCYPFAVRSNLDPLFERSHFVYTKFALQLQLFCLPNDLPSYLNQCLLPQLCSFVTLPNPSKYDDTLEASEILQVFVFAKIIIIITMLNSCREMFCLSSAMMSRRGRGCFQQAPCWPG